MESHWNCTEYISIHSFIVVAHVDEESFLVTEMEVVFKFIV